MYAINNQQYNNGDSLDINRDVRNTCWLFNNLDNMGVIMIRKQSDIIKAVTKEVEKINRRDHENKATIKLIAKLKRQIKTIAD